MEKGGNAKKKEFGRSKQCIVIPKRTILAMYKVRVKNDDNVNQEDERMRTQLHLEVIFASGEQGKLLLRYSAKDSYNDSPIKLPFYHD